MHKIHLGKLHLHKHAMLHHGGKLHHHTNLSQLKHMLKSMDLHHAGTIHKKKHKKVCI
jgi:hypothetical protein